MHVEHDFQQSLRFFENPRIPHDEMVNMISGSVCVCEEIIHVSFSTSMQTKGTY